MFANASADSRVASKPIVNAQPRMVIGVTHPQTCLILTGRLRALREAGFKVTLICSPGELLTQTAEAVDVDVMAIHMSRHISPCADLHSLWKLWRALRRLRPDVVEFSTPKAGLLGTLAAWMARVPNRIYFLRGLKLETASGLKRRILLTAERVAAYAATLILCNSESLRTVAFNLRIVKAEKIRVLGDGSSAGVDLLRFSPGNSNVRNELSIPDAAQIVGFVGRLTRDKGLPELILALKMILCARPDTYLLLVGWFDASEDALDSQLIAEIRAHPQIRTTGMVVDTVPYYRAMDLMVLPPRREGFPNVVLEASACGMPVITTHSTGARDTVVPEVTGLLIPPGYPEAISEALLKLLADASRRGKMGCAARAWVSAHYSTEKVLGENIEFYRGLVGAYRKLKGADPVCESAPNQFDNSTSEPLRQLR